MGVPVINKQTFVNLIKLNKFFSAVIKHRYLYIMILPGMALYALFCYAPMYGIQLAFKKYMYNKLIWGSPWVGFDNFKLIMKTNEFLTAFKNTFVISFGKVLLAFLAAILLSLLLNELNNGRFKRITQSILYMPHFLSWIIIYGLVFSLFSVSIGAVGRVLQDINVLPPVILGNVDAFRPLIFITYVWREAGWGTIIYLAAISGINPILYEAAIMDGAGRFRRMWHITLPSIKYVMIIVMILEMGGIMDAGFDQIFNFMDPSTQHVGDILDTYVYRLGIIKGKYDVSTAVGLFKSVINCSLMVTANWVAKLFGEEGLY